MPLSSQVPGEVYVILHVKCYRIWQNDTVIKFPTGSSFLQRKNWTKCPLCCGRCFNQALRDWLFCLRYRVLLGFILGDFICLEMEFLRKHILRSAWHMSLRNSEPKAGNGQTSVQCYCRGFGPPKHSHRHFGWNVAGESSPVFLLPSNSHGWFPLCQPESNPAPNSPSRFH